MFEYQKTAYMREGPSISEADLDRWRRAYAEGKCEPSAAGIFVPFDTGLVLYQPLVDELTKTYGRNLQRFAVGLPAFVMHEFGTGAVSRADAERWGVRFGSDSVGGRRRLNSVESAFEALRKVDLARRLPSKSEGDAHAFEMNLAPVPSRSGRLNSRFPYTADQRKKLDQPHAAIPREYFTDGGLRGVDDSTFLLLILLQCLTDMESYGGADPAHIVVRRKRLKVSRSVRDLLGLRPIQVLERLKCLEDLGYVGFVPTQLHDVLLPSAEMTASWLNSSADALDFVIRPLHQWMPKQTRDWDEPAGTGCSDLGLVAGEITPASVVFTIPKFVTNPRYSDSDKAVNDRIAMALRASVRKQVGGTVRAERAKLDYEVGGPGVALLHAVKSLSDVLVHAKVVRNDSWGEVPEVTITRTDDDGHVSINVKAEPKWESARLDVYGPIPEWRPPAPRGEQPMTKTWPSYAFYRRSLKQAAKSVPDLCAALKRMSLDQCTLDVEVACKRRCDLDDVALVVVDIVTAMLGKDAIPADKVLRQIRLRHTNGPDQVVVTIRNTFVTSRNRNSDISSG